MFSLKAFSFLVKAMKSRVLTTTALLITMISTALPARARSQADVATLNAQVRQAVCTQDWGKAVKIVDQMLGSILHPVAIKRGTKNWKSIEQGCRIFLCF